MSYLYLISLLVLIGCMLLLDWRFKLFFWHNPIAASLITLLGTGYLLLWDAAGIFWGIFFRGDAKIATGILLAPQLPLEEPIFLVFLTLCTMVLYTGSHRLLSNWSRNRGAKNNRSAQPAHPPTRLPYE